uniref:mannosyl-oligosaccharide glucosidase isoform X1 n=2 Tax=Myxine glutinosa TaxID=7769 RepID=UPI00358E6F83
MPAARHRAVRRSHWDQPEGEGARTGRTSQSSRGQRNVSGILLNTGMVLGILSILWFSWATYMRWWLAAQVVTPHSSPAILPDGATRASVSPLRFWGTYRPQVYFGMKTRSPKSLVTGLMWMEQGQSVPGSLRHACEQGDNLERYGWLAHDGINFGQQEILERDFSLSTDYVKRPGGEHGGDWSWRIAVQRKHNGKPKVVSLFLYIATDGDGYLEPSVQRDRLSHVDGRTNELGSFRLVFREPVTSGTDQRTPAKYGMLEAPCVGLEHVTQVVQARLTRTTFMDGGESVPIVSVSNRRHVAPEQLGTNSTVVVHQVTARIPFQVEVQFESGSVGHRPGPLAGEAFEHELRRHRAAFNRRFHGVFGLRNKNYSTQDVEVAQAALSNMLGGVGYFYGSSLVASPFTDAPVAYWPAALFTAVPSRSFFPRGFLWDEGFHHLLLGRWDPGLSQEVMAHWLDLLNAEGWIPREQILGGEARSRVPAQFIVQRNDNANPPTFFWTLRTLFPGLGGSLPPADTAFLGRAFPRLRSWFEWYNRTQSGPLPNSYRWRGRDADTSRFLNPKTLTSGLDDYPRASHPSGEERHVDLLCWMAQAAGVMADIARSIGEPHEEYSQLHSVLSDEENLVGLHWAEDLQAFCDWGNHSDAVVLVRERVPVPPGAPPQTRVVRVVRRPSVPQFVSAFGYVSLFPMLLRLLSPDSPRLGAMLSGLQDQNKLWTPFGLRSLARSHPLYLKRNTEHDPPYWRGYLWININYLAAGALHHYSNLDGPYRTQAQTLYQQLRRNLVKNILQEYRKTGYIWENYSDSSGAGRGSHPFTGWSSLLVLLMAEQY